MLEGIDGIASLCQAPVMMSGWSPLMTAWSCASSSLTGRVQTVVCVCMCVLEVCVCVC